MKPLTYVLLAVLVVMAVSGLFLLQGVWGDVLLGLSLVVLIPLSFMIMMAKVHTPRELTEWQTRISLSLGLFSDFDTAVYRAGFDKRYGLDRTSWAWGYGSSTEFNENVAGRPVDDQTPSEKARMFAESWNRWAMGSGYDRIDHNAMGRFLHLMDTKL